MKPDSTVLNVTQLTRAVRELLEGYIGEIWVEGEISNLRKQASGHQYFTLKDERCQVSCVLFFRPGLRHQSIPLSDGMQVQIRGEVTVYEARGQYQITVQQVQAAGAGLLQARFEALKRKLLEEGLFDPERKRELPKFPRRIGVVTSPTGAAIRDLLNVLHRRAPWLSILIWPVRVQGEGAAAEIANGVNQLNRATETGLPAVDLIIVARGGGSIEDLWAFNEEIVARAIFASEVPVVSAIGHEIDFTISDFVADLRAPTPSAAAELVAPDSAAVSQWLLEVEGRLARRLSQRVESAWQQTDSASEMLFRESRRRLGTFRNQLDTWKTVLRGYRPERLVAAKRGEVEALARGMKELVNRQLLNRRAALETNAGMLRVLSPQATLERGYSITTDQQGRVISTMGQVEPGNQIATRLRDGSIISRIEGMETGPP